MSKIKCVLCGCLCETTQKFCHACGSVLKPDSAETDAKQDITAAKENILCDESAAMPGLGSFSGMYFDRKLVSETSGSKTEPVNIYPDDSGLTLLAECCETAGPLAGGLMRSSETVLYYDEKNDGYQIHRYTAFGRQRSHEAYTTDKDHAERILKAIDTDTLLRYRDLPAPTGGSRLLIFRNEAGEPVCAECSTGEMAAVMAAVSGLMYEAVKNENRIVPGEAENWTWCSLVSTGMSMTDCYRFEVKRDGTDDVSVRGECFDNGSRRVHEEWLRLSENDRRALDKIPLGLMISDIADEPDPLSAGRFPGMMRDGVSCSFSITYGNGKTDRKIPDSGMIRALRDLLSEVFSKA